MSMKGGLYGYIQMEADGLEDGRCRKEIHPSHRESGCGRILKYKQTVKLGIN